LSRPRRRVFCDLVPDHRDLVHVPDDGARGVLQDLREALGHLPRGRNQLNRHRSRWNDLSGKKNEKTKYNFLGHYMRNVSTVVNLKMSQFLSLKVDQLNY
jgi:hypothetical protein